MIVAKMEFCPSCGGGYDTARHENCPCLERFEQPMPTGDGERVVPMVMNDLIDDVKAVMSGMLAPELQEEILGVAEVRDVFMSPKYGAIAGSMVIEGTVYRNKPIRVLRDDVVIYEGELESLRRFKDEAQEVRNGMECGIGVKNYTDVRVGDKIEVYERKEVARTLA